MPVAVATESRMTVEPMHPSSLVVAICSDTDMALEFPEGSDVLAAGRQTASIDEVEASLVAAFTTSKTRRSLFDSWLTIREAIRRLVQVDAEWIDGSYVTTKTDPEDIDVVTHIPGADLDALDPPARATLRGLISGAISQELHGCDSYVCAVYPPDHPLHAVYQANRDYWDKWFGHDRAGNPKGYVEIA